MNLDFILRKSLRKLKPYSTARDEFKGKAFVYLDANENPSESTFNRYPDPHQTKLREKLASIKNVSPNQVLIGNGSDEIIDLLFRAFCEPGIDNVIIPQPTYGMYSVCANINNVEIKQPLLTEEFQLEVERILTEINQNTKLIFICNPNNPSGNLLNLKSILTLLNQFKGLVVVDEAYIDFAKSQGLLTFLNDHPNLFVIQTLSKAWGLAGLRIGIGYGATSVISLLSKIKPPYNISSFAQQEAIKALDQPEQKNTVVTILLTEREKLVSRLGSLSFIKRIYHSDANFLLVKMANAKDCYDHLIQDGIVVRDRSSMTHCENCLRISIGTPNENILLITSLHKFQTSISK